MKSEGRNPKAEGRPKSERLAAGFSVSVLLQSTSSFGFRISAFPWLACALFLLGINLSQASDSASLFDEGLAAYRAGDYAKAADAFREQATLRPVSGTLQNLGLAEWHCARTGRAVLAWEQALWLNPFNEAARANLRFARKTAQLESPDLTWYEVVSTWLPMNWWAWASTLSLWSAVGLGALPGILRWRRAAWQQAIAALALTVFLLSLPAQLGLNTRSRI